MSEPDRLPNIHPGEILLEEFLDPMALRPEDLAREIGFPLESLRKLLRGKVALTADVALRLSRYLGTSPRFWLGLQNGYDLEESRKKLGDRLEREITPRSLPRTSPQPA